MHARHTSSTLILPEEGGLIAHIYLFRCVKMMQFVVQQLFEKIDRTRAIAGHTFQLLFSQNTPFIPHFDDLVDIVLGYA